MSLQYLALFDQFHFSIIHIFPQIINFTALCHNLDYQLILWMAKHNVFILMYQNIKFRNKEMDSYFPAEEFYK